MPAFVEAVNKQTLYNDNGEINAIPIVAYHNIDYIKNNYRHDNEFKVFAKSDLGYNQTTKKIY